jgi:hypothetical protein
MTRGEGPAADLATRTPSDSEGFENVTCPRIGEMLWFAGRWWWFPGRQITLESQFDWKTAGLTCSNPMAPPLREFCFLAKSRLSDPFKQGHSMREHAKFRPPSIKGVGRSGRGCLKFKLEGYLIRETAGC